MLPAGFGRLATYLDRRRDDLQGLVPARRRAIQHRIVDGPAADHIISGDDAAADRQLASLILVNGGAKADSICGQMKIVDIGNGDVGLLSLRGVETIRNADLVVHETGTDAAIIDLARREADFATLPDDLPGAAVREPVGTIADMVVDALIKEQLVVLLLPHASPAMAMLVGRLAADGWTAAVIPAASPP